MIELKKISIFELPNLVEFAYSGDADMIGKYWGDGFSLQEAVDETMRCIKAVSGEVEMQHYAVIYDGEEIGYVSCFPHNLYSFSINIEYRTKEILSEYWKSIKSVMGESFITMLFPQNTRAINWLKKCGMVVVDGVEQNCVTLLNVNK